MLKVARTPGEGVLQALRAENLKFFSQQADELEPLFRNLESKNPRLRKQAAEYVMARCHSRDLGDFFIRRLTANEWYGLLDQLYCYARQRARDPGKGRGRSR